MLHGTVNPVPSGINIGGSIPSADHHTRVAQLAEQQFYTLKVESSSLSPCTIYISTMSYLSPEKVAWYLNWILVGRPIG